MQRAIGETERRRAKQIAFNAANGITPRSIKKHIKEMIDGVYSAQDDQKKLKALEESAEVEALSEKDLSKRIKLLERQMLEHARNLEFE
jgi:excinuclease ABC subunit B